MDDLTPIRARPSLGLRRAGTSARERAEDARSARSFIARLLGVHTDERAWRRGAQGEELLGRQLTKLPRDRWHVFHDIPIGARGANIDHLVIGPTGVFTINTKNLTGRVWVAERALLHNGRRTSYLPKAVAEAARVAALLEIPVQPILAIQCDKMTVKAEPADVAVLALSGVRRWLERQPEDLSRSEAFQLAVRADDPSTWKVPRL